MYIAIDNKEGVIIGLHGDPTIICGLSWLYSCDENAEIQIFPICDPLRFNDLNKACIEKILVHNKIEVKEQRYENLKSLFTLAQALNPKTVNRYLLEMQVDKRPINILKYTYAAGKTVASIWEN